MALIKNTQAERIVKPGFQDLGDLKRQAEELLAQARLEASRIIEKSRVEAQARVDEAVRDGYDEGRQRGYAAGQVEGRDDGRTEVLSELSRQFGELLAGWTKAHQTWESQRASMLLAAREDIVKLALAMGEKITHLVIEAEPAGVVDQVAEALALLAKPTAVTFSIIPADRSIVQSVLGDLVASMNLCTHIDLRDDPEVSRGGCVVATDRGHIDATIDRQIQRITDTLLARTPRPRGRRRKR
ncbi:MAG: FliH/SctL family protein [Acidobacteria bacterium]|nr:FliH/SctL family protein [Acidobacteriota bacterium]